MLFRSLDFVADCRRGIEHSYDIVEGPMAVYIRKNKSHRERLIPVSAGVADMWQDSITLRSLTIEAPLIK